MINQKHMALKKQGFIPISNVPPWLFPQGEVDFIVMKLKID